MLSSRDPRSLSRAELTNVLSHGDRTAARFALFLAEDERRMRTRFAIYEVRDSIRAATVAGQECHESEDSIAVLVERRPEWTALQVMEAVCPGLRGAWLIRRASEVAYTRQSGGGQCRPSHQRILAMLERHPTWRNEHIVEIACRLISNAMSREQVRASIGRPSAIRRAAADQEVWVYPDGHLSRELVFRNDTLREQRVCLPGSRCL